MIGNNPRSVSQRLAQFGAVFLLVLMFFTLSASSALGATATRYIRSSGGDCAAIGVWNNTTKTCTLNTDLAFGVTNGIVIDGSGITVDGAGHTITGAGGNTSGVTWFLKSNVTLKNLTVQGFKYGVNVVSVTNAMINGNTFSGNSFGVYLQSSTSGQVFNNNFDANTTQAKVVSGSGNQFSLPSPTGGNWWSGYDAPVEGCNDFNMDNYCDAAYGISGASDALPWNYPSSWATPPPPDTQAPLIGSIEPGGVVSSGSATVSISYTDRSNIDTASVSVTLDGNPVAGCTATETQISCGAVSGYATGPHTIGGSVADIYGNSAAISGSFSYIDDQPPAISSLAPTGNINSATPALSASLADSGTGVDPATVTVNLDGSDLSGCGVTVTAVSCATASLPDGAHSFVVSAADIAGNTASASATFNVDTAAPVITSVKPAGIINTGASTVQVNYNDTGSGINTGSVIVNLDGTILSGCLVSAGSVSCTVKNLAMGDHAITGSVADAAGNVAAINGAFTFIDVTPPAIRDLSPPIFINKNYANVGAALSDTGTGVDTASVAVYLDGGALGGCTVTATSASCAVYGISLGAHTFSVTAGDKAGNVASADGSFTYDPLAPSVSKTIYLTNNTTGGGCTQVGNWFPSTKTCVLNQDLMFIKTNGFVFNGDGITLDGGGHYIVSTGGNTSGVVAMLRNNVILKSLKVKQFKYGAYIVSSNNVTLFNNSFSNNGYGLYQSSSSGSVVYDNNFIDNTMPAFVQGGSGNSFDQPAPDGGNYWSNYDTPAEGCDDGSADGYCDAAYAAYGVTDNLPWTARNGWPAPAGYDYYAPTISDILPSGILSSSAATISAYLSDDISGVNAASVSVYLDGHALSGCTVTASSASCGVYGLLEGGHSIVVNASDNMGNTGSGSGSFQVDLSPPGILNILPSGYISSASAAASAYVYDLVSGVNSASIAVYVQYGTMAGCTYAANVVSCPVSGLTEGRHDINVSASDNAGNSAAASSYFSVDTTPPAITSLKPTGTVAKSSATIIAYFNDSGAGVDTSSVAATLDSNPVSGCVITGVSAVCNVYGMADGPHSYTVQLTDKAGNAVSQTNNITVDTRVTTKNIRNNPTGGDCTLIGNWDNATKTCTLTSDFTFGTTNGIVIQDNGLIIEGAGHLLTGAGGYTSGISASLKSNVTVRNVAVRQFRYGVNLTSTTNAVISGNRFLSNTYGAYLMSSTGVMLYHNNFNANTNQAYVSGGSGNLFNLPLPTGGNWYSTFTTPAQGCNDNDADGFCDAPYTFTGGSDALPHVLEYPFPSG